MKKFYFRFKLFLLRLLKKSIDRIVKQALKNVDLRGLVNARASEVLKSIDFAQLANEAVDSYADDAVSEVDVDEKVDDAVENELAGFDFDYRVDEAIKEALGEFDFKESIKATIKETLTVKKLECEVVDFLNGLKFDRVANNIFREALKHYLATVDDLAPLTDEND